jgi:hypothetical protein
VRIPFFMTDSFLMFRWQMSCLLQRDWRVPERLKRELAGLYSLQAYPQAVPMSIITGQYVGRFLLAIEASELTFVFPVGPGFWEPEGVAAASKEQEARR